MTVGESALLIEEGLKRRGLQGKVRYNPSMMEKSWVNVRGKAAFRLSAYLLRMTSNIVLGRTRYTPFRTGVVRGRGFPWRSRASLVDTLYALEDSTCSNSDRIICSRSSIDNRSATSAITVSYFSFDSPMRDFAWRCLLG